MLPRPTYSNCPLAVLWLWLSGRAKWVVATRSDIGWWWPWHFGVVSEHNPDMVIHFKRTRDGQSWAPFWFEGRMLSASLVAIQRNRRFMWKREAWQVIPLILMLVAVGMPVWMLVSAFYWPWWLFIGFREAVKSKKR